MHRSKTPATTPESTSQTPKAAPRTTPEASFDQPRFVIGHNCAMAGRHEFKANSVMKSKLVEIDETESVEIEINRTEFVETNGPQSKDSDPSKSDSKSGDSLDDILCCHGVSQDTCQSLSSTTTRKEVDSSFSDLRTEFDDLEVKRTTKSSSYTKYEVDDDDFSIRFEDSTQLTRCHPWKHQNIIPPKCNLKK